MFELLNAKDTKRIQDVLVILLYYALAIDCTLVPSIGSIATDQSCATKLTMVAIVPTTLQNTTLINITVKLAPSTFKTKQNHHLTILTRYFLKTRPLRFPLVVVRVC
jgi:hypothetical protein